MENNIKTWTKLPMEEQTKSYSTEINGESTSMMWQLIIGQQYGIFHTTPQIKENEK